ncbi:MULTISPECIES: HlyD family secretion protein [Marinobacter]|uniref:HlyD family secretion protein n=1 Tax=Marinobacter TaxID=2742 RepID=UPI00177B217A|nr:MULTISPECIES: efflux RND transporter periplasmic adaptor subunit [Marinobacter]MBL3557821.1 efflux RND transporter periplasmic adaptor subunit [Marinobacter sp. JB05H06]
MKSQSWLWSLIAVLVLAGGSYGVFVLFGEEPLPQGIAYGNGHIEGREVRIAAEVTGRVIEHHLTEGSRVSAGDTIAVIDPADARDRLRSAQAELAGVREVRHGFDSQITTWRHHLMTAEKQRQRIRDLRSRNLASSSDLDQAENAVSEARGRLESLQRQKDAAEEQVAARAAQVALAESQLNKAEVVAPLSGTILIRAVETGEVVDAGQPLAMMVNLQQLELKLYVPGDIVTRISLGYPARIRVDGLSGDFSAKVARIDDFAQFTPRDVHMPDERVRMVYGVTLALDNTAEALKPGMPADAWIRWDPDTEWPDPLSVPAR